MLSVLGGAVSGCLNPYGPGLLLPLRRRRAARLSPRSRVEAADLRYPATGVPLPSSLLSGPPASGRRGQRVPTSPSPRRAGSASGTCTAPHSCSPPSWPTPCAALRGRPCRSHPGLLALGAALCFLSPYCLHQGPHFDEEIYPESGLRWLTEHDLDPTRARVIAPDFVGNWFEAIYGTDAAVFIDDRFELVPRAVIDDYLDLLNGDRRWEEILGSYEPDAVVCAPPRWDPERRGCLQRR